MGIYISLAILPGRITQKEWRKTYEESLALLQGYSGKMMSIQTEEINSAERSVYSRKLEHDVDDSKQRYWQVVGDFKSKKTGESFIFYYDLDQYRSRRSRPKSNGDEDIIVSIVEENDHHREVFSDKTQGCPYHIPLLAVAMLVEDRFPKYAHACGDLDIHQAKKAQAIVKKVLRKEIALPISVDAPRLFKRIRAHYQGKEAIDAFDQIVRGEFNGQFETLFELSDKAAFTEWFLDRLRHYTSANQLGAIDLSMAWLNATKDLKTLCELACLHENGPQFDPVEFADALASTWISVEEPLREVLRPFRKPKGETDSVATLFGAMLFDMGGLKGRGMRVYMDENKVLKILSGLFPNHAKAMEDIFKAETEKIRKNLANSRQGVQALVKRSQEEPEIGDGKSFLLLKSTATLSKGQRMMLESTAYSLARIRSKVKNKYPEIFRESAHFLHDRIVSVSERQGIILTEDAWKWIDRENDLEVLRFILMMVLIDNDEQKFWNIRQGLLENRELCKAVSKWVHDRKMLAKIAKKMETEK